MVEYLKTQKGYFYKVLKNGKKKRISQEEYNKKNKRIIGGAGEPILPEDVLYQDDLVCILKPEVKKGIIIWTSYNQPSTMDSLCKLGLKTGKKLKEEGVDFGRSVFHPYIFFKAPYYSREIDYSTLETEISSSYGDNQIIPNRVYIRVDPDRTFVFSSEIRARIPTPYFHIRDGHLINSRELLEARMDLFMKRTDEKFNHLYTEYYNTEINKSKKLLSEYLGIIKENESLPGSMYDLYSSRKTAVIDDTYPFDSSPIEESSEVLVSIPHLTKEYFVLCTS